MPVDIHSDTCIRSYNKNGICLNVYYAESEQARERARAIMFLDGTTGFFFLRLYMSDTNSSVQLSCFFFLSFLLFYSSFHFFHCSRFYSVTQCFVCLSVCVSVSTLTRHVCECAHVYVCVAVGYMYYFFRCRCFCCGC